VITRKKLHSLKTVKGVTKMSRIVNSKSLIDAAVKEEFELIRHSSIMPMRINDLIHRIVVRKITMRKWHIGPCYLPDSYCIGDAVVLDGGTAVIKA